jgi:hypothetical protein
MDTGRRRTSRRNRWGEESDMLGVVVVKGCGSSLHETNIAIYEITTRQGRPIRGGVFYGEDYEIDCS